MPDGTRLNGAAALAALVADRDFDVVIVGGGGSGAVAAIEATERGASVVVLEKTDNPGGSTQESGGTVRTLHDKDGAAEHYWKLTQGSTPREVMDAFAVGLMEIPGWIEAHGGTLVIDPRDEQPDTKTMVKNFQSGGWRAGKGHAANPMTEVDIDEKFRLLASKSLPLAEVERLRQYLLELDIADGPVSLAGFGGA